MTNINEIDHPPVTTEDIEITRRTLAALGLRKDATSALDLPEVLADLMPLESEARESEARESEIRKLREQVAKYKSQQRMSRRKAIGKFTGYILGSGIAAAVTIGAAQRIYDAVTMTPEEKQRELERRIAYEESHTLNDGNLSAPSETGWQFQNADSTQEYVNTTNAEGQSISNLIENEDYIDLERKGRSIGDRLSGEYNDTYIQLTTWEKAEKKGSFAPRLEVEKGAERNVSERIQDWILQTQEHPTNPDIMLSNVVRFFNWSGGKEFFGQFEWPKGSKPEHYRLHMLSPVK